MESGEIIYEKVYVSPRPPPKISFKDNWMKELDWEVAGSSKDTQRIQPKPKNTIIKNGETWRWTRIHKGDRERYLVWSRGHPALNKNGETRGWIELHPKLRVDASKIWEEDQTRTGRPVKMEELDIDFRVPGLPHAVVKEAEHFRVQELVKKIERHPHREALHADLQQNNVYNPFSKKSKAIICELGNVEFFDLCETIPKVKCSHCLLYWNQGIVYCTCGQFLVDSESWRKFNKLRLDALSSPNNVIKKGRSHGARHGKTEEQKEYHIAWNAWKRCWKKVDSQGGHFTGIHDRFLRDPVYRESQLAIGWTEQKCKEMDELGKQNQPYHLSTEEFKRYQGQWYLTLNKWGKNAPMRLRPDFRAAVSLKNRLVRESGEKVEEPISPEQYRRWHPSSSTSWWDHPEWKWKWAHTKFSSDLLFGTVGFVYSRWRSTVTDGECRQIHLTRHFSHALLHTIRCAYHTAWLKTSHPMCL